MAKKAEDREDLLKRRRLARERLREKGARMRLEMPTDTFGVPDDLSYKPQLRHQTSDLPFKLPLGHHKLVDLLISRQSEFGEYLRRSKRSDQARGAVPVDRDLIARAFHEGPGILSPDQVRSLLTVDLDGLTLLRVYLERADGKLPEPWLDAMDDVFGKLTLKLNRPDPSKHHAGRSLAGKKVLIVDGDVRDIVAMTSLLEPHQMEVLSAETGRGAIELLQNTPDIDIVLMDMMMPDLDFDTMRAIRKLAKVRSLPIITLTDKGIEGDRKKGTEAGASDYISKPVDLEQLLSLLRGCLYR